MKQAMQLELMGISLLDDNQMTVSGGTVIPPMWLLVGAGFGLYTGAITIAYGLGYGSHMVYDAVTSN